MNVRESAHASGLTPVVAAIGALALAGAARVAAQESDTVLVGDISVALTRTEQRGIEGSRSSVPCNTNATQLVLTFKPPIALDVDEGTEQAISKQLRLDDGSGAPLDAPLSFRNALLAGARRLAVGELIARASQTVEVPRQRCFNQTVLQRYRRVRYEARPSWAVGGLFKPGLSPFRWDEYPDAEYAVEAVYDESCAAQCVIAGKKRSVEGRDGRPVWARVSVENGTTYLVPLFYDGKGRVIDIVPLLPAAVQLVVAGGERGPAVTIASEGSP